MKLFKLPIAAKGLATQAKGVLSVNPNIDVIDPPERSAPYTRGADVTDVLAGLEVVSGDKQATEHYGAEEMQKQFASLRELLTRELSQDLVGFCADSYLTLGSNLEAIIKRNNRKHSIC